ncbi:MAG: hypothetical protein LBF26_03005 [Puniceicoccales bacterium]|jgi:hypothetical protein|nr:hypothetical protein [Puniceicoccales bacterium]
MNGVIRANCDVAWDLSGVPTDDASIAALNIYMKNITDNNKTHIQTRTKLDEALLM